MTAKVLLPNALAAWHTESFAAVFKAELEQVEAAALPLLAGLSHGSYVSGERFEVMVIGAEEAGGCIRVRAGIYYASLIAGCSCADDPTPVNELPEYCEIEVIVDKASADARIALSGE